MANQKAGQVVKVGNYELHAFKNGEFGLAQEHGNRLCYFGDRHAAVNYALRSAFGFKDPEYTYDVGFCEVRVYSKDAVSVVHVGDERSYTVHNFFDSERDALDYANGVNLKYHGVFEQ